METNNAIGAFHALSQETRLSALRMLVTAGPNGMAAGEIAEQLSVQPSTLSAHLAILERAGLVTSRREARHIFYAAHYEGLRSLIAFLTEDCCQGRPEICGDTAAQSCVPNVCAPQPNLTARGTRKLAAAGISTKRK